MLTVDIVGAFPWWPAVVFEEDDLEVPSNVLDQAPRPLHPGVVLVRFYEKKHTHNWYACSCFCVASDIHSLRSPRAWLSLKNIRYLGEDDSEHALHSRV